MSEKIAVAQGSNAARDTKCAASGGGSAIRRDLAMLWVAQTLRNIHIIGLSRTQTAEIVHIVLDRWCREPAQPAEPKR